MPSYVPAAFAPVILSLAVAALVPAPRMSPARARRLCFWLMSSAIFAMTVTIGLLVLTLRAPTSGTGIMAPAVTILFAAMTLGITMLWLAAAPREEQNDRGPSDGGDGGGGPPVPEQPPPPPGPSDGALWDTFDRERETWSAPRKREGAGV